MHKWRSLFLFVVVLLAVNSVQAIVYLVPSDRELVRRAEAIVIATGVTSHPELNPGGMVVTVAELQISTVLKGNISGDSIRLVELGGTMSERATLIPGSPRYEEGKEYLLMLERWPSGEWRTFGFQLGQFEFTRDLRGREMVSRGGDELLFGLNEDDGTPYVDQLRSLDGFLSFVRVVAQMASAPARGDYFIERVDAVLAQPARPQPAFVPAPNATRPDYLLSGNFRWQSGPVRNWGYCCPGGYPSAPLNGPSAASSAVGAWNDASTSVRYTMTGETPTRTGGLSTDDGANTVLFDDPANLIGSSGAIGIGGISNTAGSYMLADGFTYNNTSEVDVVITKNSKLPGFMTQSLLVSLTTHEVGHTLGFRHSNGTGSPSSPPPSCSAPSPCAGVGSAVMANQINAPGLSLQAWDRDAVQTVYGAGPVCTAPSISAQPASQTITSGNPATMTVTATGSTPLSYQWYVGTTGTVTTPTGTNSPSLTVSPTSTTQYWVRVTGQCAPTADSATATITVNPAVCTPVSITTQPIDQSVTAGGTVQLTVGFTGTAPVTVTWFRGTFPDDSQNVGSGQTIFSPQITQPTQFWARLSNCSGGTTINTRTLTVNVSASCAAPGGLNASASPTSINPGQQVALQVFVTIGTQPFLFQWFRGLSGDQSNPISGATSFQITDSPTTTTNYWVKVTNCSGNSSANSNTVTVTVNTGTGCTPPSITAQPVSETIVIGTSTTLSVAAAGTGTLHFQWFRGNAGDTSTPVGSDSASFTTPALTAITSYWVRVTGQCTPAADSSTATLRLKSGRPRAVRH